MARLKVLCSMALAGLVGRMMPEIEASEIVRVEAEFLPTAALMPRLRDGEAADVALLTRGGIEALLQEGVVVAGTEVDVARSHVGVAVRAGAAHPEIGTVEGFVAALRGAPSIAMSKRGASGLYLAELLERLGVAEEVGRKAVIVEDGLTAELAADGRVSLALQQVSELMLVRGIEVVGRLPAELGGETVFAGAVVTGSAQEEAGMALLRDLAGAGPLLGACGLEAP